MTISLHPKFRRPALAVALTAASFAGGCSGDSNMFSSAFSTGSINEQAAVTKASADPACATLATQIDTLRKDGATGRLEKAADGKTTTVIVQRASLAKQVQLNKANADFVAKCGPNQPKAAVTAAVAAPAAAVAPAAAAAAATAPAKPAAAAAKKALAPAADLSGVTVAAPASPSLAVPKAE